MSIKKLIAGFVFLLAFFIFIQWLIGYLQYGQLDITTNNSSNTITLTAPLTAKNSGSKPFSVQAQGSLSLRLKATNYLVTVENGSDSTAQPLTVKAHSTTHIYVNVPNAGGIEPVTFDNASDMVADSSELVYLDPIDSSINTVDTQNQDTETYADYGFQSIKWADTNFGVAQNANGNLYVLQNGSVNPLISPVSYKSNSSLVFAVAPNRTIYIGRGSDIYKGTANGGFKTIYTMRQKGSVLSAGLNKVTIINTGYSGTSASIVTIDDSGKQTEQTESSFINTYSSWSPDDKYIVISGSSTGMVLNSSMQQVATIPQGDFTNPIWLNNHTLLYSIEAQIWSYNIRTQRSQVIANMPLAEQVQELAISTDGSYVYAITTNPANPGIMAVRRVGLRGQQVSAMIYELQDILPQSTPGVGYALGLINFSGKPSVQIVLSDGSDPQTSLQSTRQELQSDGFNLNAIQFTIVQGD